MGNPIANCFLVLNCLHSATRPCSLVQITMTKGGKLFMAKKKKAKKSSSKTKRKGKKFGDSGNRN
jgi:hypothetical protein